MYKLKNSYIDKMIEQKCSNVEIRFILYISNYQDDYGTVHSVYYKDICQFLCISIQKYYDLLEDLKEKGLISYVKPENRKDREVTLIGNDFSDQSFNEGYLKVSSINFYDSRFVNLLPGSKLLFLYMQRYTNGRHSGVQKFYEDFCALFGVSKKTLQSYIHELKKSKLLGISKKRNRAYHYEMTLKKTATIERKGSEPNEKDEYMKNIRKAIRLNFEKYLPDNAKKFLDDVTGLIVRKLDDSILQQKLPSILMKAIIVSIKRKKQENPSKVYLNAAFTNTIFTEMLARPTYYGI